MNSKNLFFFLCFIAGMVFSAEALAYKLSPSQGAVIIEIERGDTVSAICEKKAIEDSLPLNMGRNSCIRNVLYQNFGTDLLEASVWARTIKPGDLLFFPDKPREAHDAIWLEKIEEARVKAAAERNTEISALQTEKKLLADANSELQEKRSNLIGALVAAAGIILILAGVYLILKRKKESEFEQRLKNFLVESEKWKPGSVVHFEFYDSESGKTVRPVFKVIGSKLKKYPSGIVEPCAVWESPYDGSALDTSPPNNIRNHIRRNIRKADEEFINIRTRSLALT